MRAFQRRAARVVAKPAQAGGVDTTGSLDTATTADTAAAE